MATNAELFAAAQELIPGGVDSPVRAFGAVGSTPAFIESAAGAYVYDAEGCERVDLVGSWGPMLLGHAHPEVVAAVQAAATRSLSFGAPTSAETELAAEVRRRVPAAEKVRFVSTGTEATMTAIRLARAFTGRDLLVKFAGCYHGHSDGLLAAAGSGVATGGLPASAGVPTPITELTLVLPYNDVEALRQCFAAQGEKIAAVIFEGAPCNMGVVPPAPGFHTELQNLARAHGALLIMDEVLTGFRLSPAGFWGLQSGPQSGAPVTGFEGGQGRVPCEDIRPDLFTFGKVIGGGMPLAALGGRAEIMDLLAPLGPVYQAGTLSGNPLSTAAGLTTLRLAGEAVYTRVDAAADALVAGLREEFARAGLAAQINRVGSLFSVFFGEGQVSDYASAQASETWRYGPFFRAMMDGGVALPPSAYEAWFVSAAHDDTALGRILEALPAAVAAAGAARYGD